MLAMNVDITQINIDSHAWLLDVASASMQSEQCCVGEKASAWAYDNL